MSDHMMDPTQTWPAFVQQEGQYKVNNIYDVAPSFLGDLSAYFTMNPFPVPIEQVTGYQDTARVIQDSGAITGTQATIQFDNIPGNYFGIAIRYIARCDAAVASSRLQLQFNNDGGLNYHGTLADRTGATWANVQTNHNIGSIPIGEIPGATATQTNTAGAGLIEIPGYASPTFTALVTSKGVVEVNNQADAQLFDVVGAGQWNTAAVVTSITLQPASGNFVAGSRAVLYGF